MLDAVNAEILCIRALLGAADADILGIMALADGRDARILGIPIGPYGLALKMLSEEGDLPR